MLIQNLIFLLLSVISLTYSHSDNNIQYSVAYNNEIFTATANNFTQILQNIRRNATSKNPSPKPKPRRKINKRNSIELVESKYYKYEIVGPRCIPLVSKNIDANPYHASLLSLPYKVVRRGVGLPTLIHSINPIDCKSNTNGCTISISKSVSTTVTESISMSLSNGESQSISLGSGISKGLSNSYAKTIGESLEKSLSQANTLSDDNSLSQSISEAVQQSHEKSSGITKTTSKDEAESITITQDKTDSDTITTERTISKAKTKENIQSRNEGGSELNTKQITNEQSTSYTETDSFSVGVSFWGVSASYDHSSSKTTSQSKSTSDTRSEEKNWSNTYSNSQSLTDTSSDSNSNAKTSSLSVGRSTGNTKSFSSSASDENRESDSISVTRDAARTLVKSQANSNTSTDTSTKAYRIDDSFTSSNETSINFNVGNSTDKSRTFTNTSERSFSYTITNSQDHNLPVPPGTCQMAVCKSFVKSVVIPYECIRETNDGFGKINIAYDLVPVIYSLVDLNVKNVSCIYSTIDCNERYELSQIFHDDNNEFLTATEENSLEYGMEMHADERIQSKDGGRFTLELMSDGDLQLKKGSIVLWQNGMGFFEGYEDIRVRINEKGHLIEEVIGLFNETVPHYRNNEWITVWSSAPINHNVTIGIPTLQGMFKSYKLVLEESGHLNLYDSVGVLIWTPTVPDAMHKRGYKFPEVYLVPTNFETPEVPGDKHNSLPDGIKIRTDLSKRGLKSLDDGCMYLEASEAIESANGHFKMILEPSGNMIIKDGFRTMWETSSANLPHGIPPYKLFVSPTGEIMIIDAAKHIIWSAILIDDVYRARGPFKLMLEDNGRLNVTDKNERTVWDSSPIDDMSFGTVTFDKRKYRYVRCHDKVNNGFSAELYRNGDKYHGYWKDGKREGMGTLVFENGDVYNGSWKADLQNGFGDFISKNVTVYKGFWKNGYKDGNGTDFYSNGDRVNAIWSAGRKNGKGVYYFANSDKYEAQFENDVVKGKVNFYFANKDKCIDCEMKNNKLNGFGKIQYSSGSYYEGQLKDNVRHGNGTLKDKNSEFSGEFKNNLLNGKGKWVGKDKSVYEGDWKNHKKDGYGILKSPDRSRYEGQFKDDLRHGKGTFYWGDNEKYEGDWFKNMKHGKGIYSDADGRMHNYTYEKDNLISNS